MFSAAQRAYLESQRLARIGTVSPSGQVDVAPVGFSFDGERFSITGRQINVTLKYKNVAAGNRRVALVVDDVKPGEGWHPRGIKVHGEATILQNGGPPIVQIRPTVHWHWGIEGSPFDIRKVVWEEG
jgi:pyridoxamine 5'-phosphate oxidase family protein